MKRFSRLYIIGFLWTSLSLSAQENILTSRVLREPVQKVSEVNDANSVTTIEYYDTAGRLIQTIRKGFDRMVKIWRIIFNLMKQAG